MGLRRMKMHTQWETFWTFVGLQNAKLQTHTRNLDAFMGLRKTKLHTQKEENVSSWVCSCSYLPKTILRMSFRAVHTAAGAVAAAALALFFIEDHPADGKTHRHNDHGKNYKIKNIHRRILSFFITSSRSLNRWCVPSEQLPRRCRVAIGQRPRPIYRPSHVLRQPWRPRREYTEG